MKAFELLATEDKWTKKNYAQEVKGIEDDLDSLDPRAACWCLAGALERVYPDRYLRQEKRDAIRQEIGTIQIAQWNDAPERTHAEVVALLKKLDI